ncbi:MAG: YkvA family protein [Chloroherpetonaceae bacterium]|nr:YkvA family protein [Chloroherpetonaceae bacterium]
MFKKIWKFATGWEKATFFVLVLYAISPIDLFPEAFFGPFGFADDFGALLLFAKMVWNILQRAKKSELENASKSQDLSPLLNK